MRRALFSYLLAILALATSAAEAGPLFCAHKLLEKYSGDPCRYGMNSCHLNTLNLLRKMTESIDGFNIQDANVLYVMSRPGEKLRLIQSRHGDTPFNGPSWFYHVVLEYRGRIYDMDLPVGALPKTREQYFQGIYSSRISQNKGTAIARDRVPPNHLEGIQIRSIQGETYLKEYGEKSAGGPFKDVAYFYNRADTQYRFPTQAASEYLRKPVMPNPPPSNTRAAGERVQVEYSPSPAEGPIAIRLFDIDTEYVFHFATREFRAYRNGQEIDATQLKRSFFDRMLRHAEQDRRLYDLLISKNFWQR